MANRATLTTDAWDHVYTYLQTTNAISTNNIFSAWNSTLATDKGYPLVIIEPPIVGYQKLILNGRKTESPINFTIEVYHTSSQNVKAVMDEVTAKLLEGRETLFSQGLKRMQINPGDYDTWREGDKKIHKLGIEVSFIFIASS